MTEPDYGEKGCAQGSCKSCGQELLITPDDCWHPYTVKKPCPAGGGFGRPGRECWTDRLPEPEPYDHEDLHCQFPGCEEYLCAEVHASPKLFSDAEWAAEYWYQDALVGDAFDRAYPYGESVWLTKCQERLVIVHRFATTPSYHEGPENDI